MLGDITFRDQNNATGTKGTLPFQVLAGVSATLINSGEPVGYALGQQYALNLATAKPVVGTDYLCGIAASLSTQTPTLDGSVQVAAVNENDVLLIAPKVPATYLASQATYNALVGARVTLDLTAGVWTINSTDGSTNGCVIRDLDITKYPGKVAFSFRNGTSYLS